MKLTFVLLIGLASCTTKQESVTAKEQHEVAQSLHALNVAHAPKSESPAVPCDKEMRPDHWRDYRFGERINGFQLESLIAKGGAQ